MANIEILPEDFPNYDLSFKIVIIGDSGTGKSSFSNKAIHNSFMDEYNATVGFEFLALNFKKSNTVIKLQIWDTCGQNIYRTLIKNFFRNASLAILVYSIDNKESFQHIEYWLEYFKKENTYAKIALVGNKLDLEESRKVSKDEGENFAKENNLNMFFETSAKSGNVQKALIEAVELLIPRKNMDEFLQTKSYKIFKWKNY